MRELMHLLGACVLVAMIMLVPKIDREQRRITKQKGETAAWLFTLGWCCFCLAVTALLVSAYAQT